MSVHEEKAKQLFLEGYNCAQAVFIAFAEDRMDRQTAAALASSFGGGMGGMREVCGALSGAFMALGLLEGNYDPNDRGAKTAHYARVRAIAEKFREENGTFIRTDTVMENGKVYLVRKAEWHALDLQPGAKCLIAENEDTSNSEFAVTKA